MRFAVVIEKAESNYRPMCRTCRAASRRATRSKRSSAKFATPSAFTSTDCARTACRCRRRPASRSMWRREVSSEAQKMISDDDESNWHYFFEKFRANIRADGRGSYWHSKDKQEKETAAAKEVLTAAGHEVRELCSRPQGQDPPDCEAIVDGQRCGIEVSELLDRPTLEATIETSRKGVPVPEQYRE